MAEYRHRLPDGLLVTSTRPEHAEQLERLQIVVFPSLTDAQRFKCAHYRHHLDVFAPGQFVVEDGDRVVAATSTIRRAFDFANPHHTFAEIIQGGWLTSHQPEGDWLYGADLGVHPDYRRRGLAVALYRARHDLVRRLGLRGQITAGMLSGFGAVRDRVTIDDYYAGLKAGRISDPTVSMQLKVGFEIRGLLENHLDDPSCGNYCVLIALDADQDIEGVPSSTARPER